MDARQKNQRPDEGVIRLLFRDEVGRANRTSLGAFNHHLADSAIATISGLSKRGRIILPRLDELPVSQLLGCFREDFARFLAEIVLDPKHVIAGDTHDLHGMADEIRAKNQSLSQNAAEEIALRAVQAWQFTQFRHDDGASEFLDTASDIRRQFFRLTREWREEDADGDSVLKTDTTWEDAFDELVLKPLIASMLREEVKFADYPEFWAHVIGFESEEDMWIFGDGDGEFKTSPWDGFSHVRELIGERDDARDFVLKNSAGLSALVHKEPERLMAISSFGELVSVLGEMADGFDLQT